MEAILARHWISEAVLTGTKAGGRDDMGVNLIAYFCGQIQESRWLGC